MDVEHRCEYRAVLVCSDGGYRACLCSYSSTTTATTTTRDTPLHRLFLGAFRLCLKNTKVHMCSVNGRFLNRSAVEMTWGDIMTSIRGIEAFHPSRDVLSVTSRTSFIGVHKQYTRTPHTLLSHDNNVTLKPFPCVLHMAVTPIPRIRVQQQIMQLESRAVLPRRRQHYLSRLQGWFLSACVCRLRSHKLL